MSDTKFTILCTHCGKSVSVDDALTHQIQEKFRGEFESEFQKKEQEFSKRTQELTKKSEEMLRLQKEVEESKKDIQNQIHSQLQVEKKKIEQEALKQASLQSAQEMKLLEDQLKEKDRKLDEARRAELEIRKQKNDLEEEKKAFELEKQRQIDEERSKIRFEVLKMAEEEHRLKDMEKDKKLQDAIKANEELRRKLEQGSQQTQGEVLELELETSLRNAFPYDEIVPVAKGVNGADVLQKVRDRSGRDCGVIAWESKHTKAWSDGWISKLKDDQRQAKAEVAVLVSKVLPNGVANFGSVENIWVSSFESALPLATALRSNLIQITSLKSSMVGKNEKMEVIYNYLCGTEFKQKIEAIVESFVALQDDLNKEKKAFAKMWATREKQIQRVIDNTTGMYGDLHGLIGSSLPQIASLELPGASDNESELVSEGSSATGLKRTSRKENLAVIDEAEEGVAALF